MVIGNCQPAIHRNRHPTGGSDITFADIPNKTVQSANFNLSATASSGSGQLCGGLGTSATVESNGTVTITGAGVTTIRASQDGNASYNPAPTVEKTLTVNKVSQSITFGTLSNASLTLDLSIECHRIFGSWGELCE